MIIKARHIFFLLLLISLVGCDQQYLLEGNNKNYDDTDNYTGDTGGDTGADTGGDTGDAGDTADSGDAANTGDVGNSADTADAGNTVNTGNSGNSGNSGGQDETEFPDMDITDPSSFPDDFNLSQCECGESPIYEPICCNKTVGVFNTCFANCFSHYSTPEKMLCDEYVESACAPSENIFSDQDILFDEDEIEDEDEDEDITTDKDISFDSDADNVEVSDEDFTKDCGCYPEDFQAWCCNNGIVYISKCLANCNCSQNYILCPSQ